MDEAPAGQSQSQSPKPAASPGRLRAARVALPLVLVGALVTLGATLDLRPSLSHLDATVLSGAEQGNYFAIVKKLSGAAAARRGLITGVATAGSGDNIARLAAARDSCEAQIALVQADVTVPEGAPIELYARFAKAESIFFLGKDADRISDFAALRGRRIALGPEKSGSAELVQRVFGQSDLASLGVRFSHHPLPEQLDAAQRGEVDLAAIVIDEDAALVESAVRDRGLQIAHFPNADVVARRFPFLRHGRIGAGQYDAVRMLPPSDRRVLRVDTLLVGNGCASRSQVIGVLRAVTEVFPDLVHHNREAPPIPGIPLASAAKSYFDNGGPELLDEHLPRVADVMPLSNWVQVVMAVSVLFNVMGLANRFVLWRIDAGRVKAEQQIARSFGPSTTLGDIARSEPEGPLLRPEVKTEMDRVITRLEELAARSRKYSLSVLCPMGGEMAYRYQESLIHEALAVLRAFRERWVKASRQGATA